MNLFKIVHVKLIVLMVVTIAKIRFAIVRWVDKVGPS